MTVMIRKVWLHLTCDERKGKEGEVNEERDDHSFQEFLLLNSIFQTKSFNSFQKFNGENLSVQGRAKYNLCPRCALVSSASSRNDETPSFDQNRWGSREECILSLSFSSFPTHNNLYLLSLHHFTQLLIPSLTWCSLCSYPLFLCMIHTHLLNGKEIEGRNKREWEEEDGWTEKKGTSPFKACSMLLTHEGTSFLIFFSIFILSHNMYSILHHHPFLSSLGLNHDSPLFTRFVPTLKWETKTLSDEVRSSVRSFMARFLKD